MVQIIHHNGHVCVCIYSVLCWCRNNSLKSLLYFFWKLHLLEKIKVCWHCLNISCISFCINRITCCKKNSIVPANKTISISVLGASQQTPRLWNTHISLLGWQKGWINQVSCYLVYKMGHTCWWCIKSRPPW